ncbi:hypothetical protein ACFQ0D_31015, partial [Micromonospora zhanjiangensis]
MRSATSVSDATRPTAADFYRVNRGGGLFSEAISQRIGAALAVGADRAGLPPTALTLRTLVLGLAASLARAAAEAIINHPGDMGDDD